MVMKFYRLFDNSLIFTHLKKQSYFLSRLFYYFIFSNFFSIAPVNDFSVCVRLLFGGWLKLFGKAFFKKFSADGHNGVLGY